MLLSLTASDTMDGCRMQIVESQVARWLCVVSQVRPFLLTRETMLRGSAMSYCYGKGV